MIDLGKFKQTMPTAFCVWIRTCYWLLLHAQHSSNAASISTHYIWMVLALICCLCDQIPPRNTPRKKDFLWLTVSEGLVQGQLAECVGPISRKKYHTVRMCGEKGKSSLLGLQEAVWNWNRKGWGKVRPSKSTLPLDGFLPQTPEPPWSVSVSGHIDTTRGVLFWMSTWAFFSPSTVTIKITSRTSLRTSTVTRPIY